MEQKREIWIDDVKVIACVLVFLGHLMQSMVSADIVPDGAMYQWFNKTIYFFHVPLFFICSGYLYQKFSCVDSIGSWSRNVLKKLVALSIPYFTFTIATWLIKTFFSGAGNNEVGNIFETLFLKPTSPYWYLYALFFIFLITPTFRNSSLAIIGSVVSLVMKSMSVSGILSKLSGGAPYAISTVFSNEIWFVIGMCLCVFKVRRMEFKKITMGFALSVIFLVLSILLRDVKNGFVSFLLGLMACTAVVLIYMDRERQEFVMAFLSKYTMPIFLMHSIFAATLRSVLLKVGIHNAAVHIVCGIAISIFGPVIAAWIMEKTKYLEFFIYPGKFIKFDYSKRQV